MQERQAELLKEQQKKQELQKEKQKTVADGWGSSLDLLGGIGSNPVSLASTPKPASPMVPDLSGSSGTTKTSVASNDIDPFDVFNKPPPPKQAPVQAAPKPISASQPSDTLLEGFTDAFPSRPAPSQTTSATESPRSVTRTSTPASSESNQKTASPHPVNGDPRDPFIAELVDMGFSVDQAKRGLANTDNGLDVRQAVDFLMTEAHRKATGKTETARPSSAGSRSSSSNQSPDISKLAQDFSNQFLTKGMSFFNQGRKNIAKAIEQYTVNTPDDGTPAWMRHQEKYKQREARAGHRTTQWDEDAEEVDLSNVNNPRQQKANNALTDEAMALESSTKEDFVKPRSSSSKKPVERMHSFKDDVTIDRASTRSASPRIAEQARQPLPSRQPHPSRQPEPSRPKPSQAPTPSVSRAQQFKSKGFDDDVAYVSPARRRQPPPKRTATPTEFKSTIPDRPKVAPRATVSVSQVALEMYSTARTSGTEAFKRGDFTEATVFYSKALESIPSTHLLRTIVLSNRSACYMKLGDAKSALVDADEGLALVGPGLGHNEEAERGKPLKDIWSKLITKKAEALESRERFKDSLDMWNLLIENGFSTKVSLDGKRRCQKALEPKKAPTPKPVSKPTTPIQRTSTPADGEALKRVRAANQSAEKEETEKFALVDIVEEKINGWRGGKEDNLRGLISTVDVLLWPELNWKKVSLAELVLPKKVKINYMKAVAKTHPDKVPANATTEQKMIAQAVFVTLNKAWDEFKAANGLN